jgi:TRAP-type C4-dicarboxylate transport system substrate-binding protein
MLIFWGLASAPAHSADAENENTKAKKIVWKTGTLAPKGIGYANEVENVLIPAVEKVSDGNIILKVYWGGVLGDDTQHLEKLRIGQLQAAGLSGQGTFMISPEIPVLGLPFLFNDYDEVDFIKHVMIDSFEAITLKQGLRLIVWLDQDFDQIYSSKLPIVKAEDFPKARFATWFGPLEGKLLERMGTTPVPISVSEIPTSLRAGVADSMIAPSIWVVGTQLYSTFRFVNPIKIRYVPAFAVCTAIAWDELPEIYKKRLYKLREGLAKDFCVLSRADAKNCLKAMLKYGVKMVESTPEDLARIREKSLPIYGELAGRLYPKALLEEIQAHLSEFRAEKAGSPH